MFDWLTRRAVTTEATSLRIAPRILHDRYPSAGEYERLTRTCATATRTVSSWRSPRSKICSGSRYRVWRAMTSRGGRAGTSMALPQRSRSPGRSRAERQRSI